jgi:hypothetical protein
MTTAASRAPGTPPFPPHPPAAVRHFGHDSGGVLRSNARSECDDQLPDPTKQNSPEATHIIKIASGPGRRDAGGVAAILAG